MKNYKITFLFHFGSQQDPDPDLTQQLTKVFNNFVILTRNILLKSIHGFKKEFFVYKNIAIFIYPPLQDKNEKMKIKIPSTPKCITFQSDIQLS